MLKRGLAGLAAVSVLLMVLITASPLARSAGSPVRNLQHNVQPTLAFELACYSQTAPTVACDQQAVQNIDRARAAEGLAPIRLPAHFTRLAVDAQIVVVSNAERTARGLRAVRQTTAADDKLAQRGAGNGSDPAGPPGKSWGSNWAGIADPLAADFLWMYDDGPGSPNQDCRHAGDPGCWGHRDTILGASWTTTGAGHYGSSVAQLFVSA